MKILGIIIIVVVLLIMVGNIVKSFYRTDKKAKKCYQIKAFHNLLMRYGVYREFNVWQMLEEKSIFDLPIELWVSYLPKKLFASPQERFNFNNEWQKIVEWRNL